MDANIKLTFSQLMALVKELPNDQKIELSKELEREAINSKLTALLTVFKTDDLSIDDINKEVEAVRQKIHDKRSR